MKSSLVKISAILFTAFCVTIQLNAQDMGRQSQHKYYVFNLGTPLGGNTEPVAVNNLGWISGAANAANEETSEAELWVGAPLALGTLGGPNSAVEWPNHSTRGEIVGIAETAQANPLGEAWSCSAFFPTATYQICLGFAWQNGVMSALPTLGGYDGYAAGVNNKGQIVGWAETNYHDPTCTSPQVLQFEAAVWGPRLNEVTALKPYGSDSDSAATAINDRGEVVGISGICSIAVGGASAQHAVIWQHGVPADMGNLGGQAWNTPVAINDQGVVTGFVNPSGDQNAPANPIGFVWTKQRGMREIFPVAETGDTNSIGFDINNRNQIAGQSFGATSGLRAMLWENGVSTDLNSLVIGGDTNLDLILAQGINDSGEIAGTAVDSNTGLEVGFLAVPVDDGSGNPPSAKTMSHPVVSAASIWSHLNGFSKLVLQPAAGK